MDVRKNRTRGKEEELSFKGLVPMWSKSDGACSPLINVQWELRGQGSAEPEPFTQPQKHSAKMAEESHERHGRSQPAAPHECSVCVNDLKP